MKIEWNSLNKKEILEVQAQYYEFIESLCNGSYQGKLNKKDQLFILTESKFSEVLICAANDTAANSEILRILTNKNVEEVLPYIALNPNLDLDIIKQLAEINKDLLVYVAKNPIINIEIVDYLLENCSIESIGSELAENQSLSDEIIDLLLGKVDHNSLFFWWILRYNHNLSISSLTKLVKLNLKQRDHIDMVISAALKQPNCNFEILLILAPYDKRADTYEAVRMEYCKEEVLELIKHLPRNSCTKRRVRDIYYKDPNVFFEDDSLLSRFGDYILDFNILTDEKIRKIYKNSGNNKNIARKLAILPHTPVDILEDLANNNPTPALKKLILSNPKMSKK